MRGALTQRCKEGREAGSNLGKGGMNNTSLHVPPRMTCRMHPCGPLPFLLILRPLPAARDTLTNKPLTQNPCLGVCCSGASYVGRGGTVWATVPPAGRLHTHPLTPCLRLHSPVTPGRHRYKQTGGPDHGDGYVGKFIGSCRMQLPQMAVKTSPEVRVNPHEPSTTPVRPPPPPTHTEAVLSISPNPLQALVPFHLPRVS